MIRILLAFAALCGLAMSVPARASDETPEAKIAASEAAAEARDDMLATFGDKQPKPGRYFWSGGSGDGDVKLIIGLTDQRAYLYRGDTLVAVAAISTGVEGRDTPTGIFRVLDKKKFYRSRKYDNAPMPHMQRIDQYGIALHGGYNPGYPASHGCIRLPPSFAARLYAITRIGTPVLIGS